MTRNPVAKRSEPDLGARLAPPQRRACAMSDAMIGLDEGGSITMFSEGAEVVFQYPRAEVIGNSVEVLVCSRMRASTRAWLDAFVTGDAAAQRLSCEEGALMGLRKDGEEFPIDGFVSKFNVGAREVVAAVVRDLAPHAAVSREARFLAEASVALAATLDYEETLACVARLALEGRADCVVLDVPSVDRGAWRMKVAHADSSRTLLCEALERASLDRLRRHLTSAVVESRRPVLTRDVDAAYIASIAQGDDSLRALAPSSLMVVPLVARERVVGAIAFIASSPSPKYGLEDLGHAVEFASRAALAIDNAYLYTTARRELKNRDELLGLVVDNLRDPLSTIVLAAGLLRSEFAEPSVDAAKLPNAILRATGRMNHLIKDLLDVIRIEADRLSLEPAQVSAKEVVRDVVNAQVGSAAANGIELRADLARSLPDVWADRDRLAQALENLVDNARKFSPKGGRVTVGAVNGDGEVMFWVADGGNGIPPETQRHLFDRFWQAQSGPRHGAGLGLTIVKSIVESHGGRIWVDSAAGRGSTFFFTIPTVRRVLRGARAH